MQYMKLKTLRKILFVVYNLMYFVGGVRTGGLPEQILANGGWKVYIWVSLIYVKYTQYPMQTISR